MMFLGLILIAAAVVLGAGVALDSTGPAKLVAFGETVPGVTAQWQVFFAGAAVAVVFVVGMMMVFAGLGRLLRSRRDLRYLREEHEESLTTLEMEKRRLQRELARVRRDGGPAAQNSASAPTPAPAPVPGPAAARAPQAQATRPAPPEPARSGPRSQVSAASSFFDRTD
ncbi:hypothetical protein [Spirillospora sp. NBC_01491]|uniref:hypothetical protein n=1 Tax=Spirillospora sp. NBC_01491 TaxID=2976007 RepID=UPI002E2EAD35|nr:hypothetical protein [Spirillospora sp. NBC_01491]